jgi:hypothetical protein
LAGGLLTGGFLDWRVAATLFVHNGWKMIGAKLVDLLRRIP